MRKIFYCRRCGFVGSDNESASPACPKCGARLLLTSYTADEWHGMTVEEKAEAKHTLAEVTKTTVNNILLESEEWKSDMHEMKEYIRRMEEDIHFMKTVLLTYLIVIAVITLLMIKILL